MDKAVKKNLIYFVYWQPDSPALWLNLKLMDRYLHLFDGERIVKVAGAKKEDIPVHIECLWDAEFVENDPVLNEAPHFKDSLPRLKQDGSITFYAHAKGVSREFNDPLKWWLELLYLGNLSYPPKLDGAHFSGCFGKLRKGSRHVPVPWHYSGSFYWFDTNKVMARYTPERIPREIDNRWFTENFPGWIARQSEAQFKLYASAEMRYNCYRQDFWNKNKYLLKHLQ